MEAVPIKRSVKQKSVRASYMDIDSYMKKLERHSTQSFTLNPKHYKIGNHMQRLSKKAISFYEEEYKFKLDEVQSRYNIGRGSLPISQNVKTRRKKYLNKSHRVKRKSINKRLAKIDKTYKTPLNVVLKMELIKYSKSDLSTATACSHAIEDLLRAVDAKSKIGHSTTRIVNRTM